VKERKKKKENIQIETFEEIFCAAEAAAEKYLFSKFRTFSIFHFSIQLRSVTSFPVDLLLNSTKKTGCQRMT